MENTKIETRLEVVNEENSKVAKLYLSGTIRKSYPWEEEGICISANAVKRELDNLGDKDVEVYLNSGGGDVFESIEICNMLSEYKGNVNIKITGRAGSGASVIATASKVSMYKNTMQMVHKASTIVSGNADDLRKMATDLDKIDKAVKASYMNKFVGTEEELTGLIAEATWLTADECLAFGLCNEIIEDKTEEEPKNDISIKVSLFDKYKVVASTKETLFNKFKNNGGIE